MTDQDVINLLNQTLAEHGLTDEYNVRIELTPQAYERRRVEYLATHHFTETSREFIKRIADRNNPMSEADEERLNHCTYEGWAVTIGYDGRPL